MWNHTPQCGCPVCFSLPRLFTLISTGTGSPDYHHFVNFVGNQLRHLEGEIRDEVARRFPDYFHCSKGSATCPCYCNSDRGRPCFKGGDLSLHPKAGEDKEPSLLLGVKVAPPVPPPHLAQGVPKKEKSTEPEPSDSHQHRTSIEKKESTAASSRRSRSRERRRSRLPRRSPRGGERPPSPVEETKKKRSKDRDRKRRRSSSSRPKRSEGGREKKRRPERPPEPPYPPSFRREGSTWGPREPTFPPPVRQGRGWQGELPDHLTQGGHSSSGSSLLWARCSHGGAFCWTLYARRRHFCQAQS